jgi:hypothetical protein
VASKLVRTCCSLSFFSFNFEDYKFSAPGLTEDWSFFVCYSINGPLELNWTRYYLLIGLLTLTYSQIQLCFKVDLSLCFYFLSQLLFLSIESD